MDALEVLEFILSWQFVGSANFDCDPAKNH